MKTYILRRDGVEILRGEAEVCYEHINDNYNFSVFNALDNQGFEMEEVTIND